MGVHPNVGFSRFPRQSKHIGTKVRVCFGYNLDSVIEGRIVRDDLESPYVGIIKLDDGRYIRTTECQYNMKEV